jgi:hypothetical protein
MINDQTSNFSNDNTKLQDLTNDEFNSNVNSYTEYFINKKDEEKKIDKDLDEDKDKEKNKNIQIYEINKNINNNINSNLKLSKNVRWFIFIILLLISIMVNMDHGTIPAATLEIKESLKAGDDILGVFGSLVFFGNIIGKYLSIIS